VKEEGAKLLGFVVATAVLVSLAIVFGGRLLTAAAGPENELVTLLKRHEREGLAFDRDGALVGQRVSYQRLSVNLAADGASATVSCTLDFTGSLGATQVSSLGFEKIPFVLKAGEWTPVDGPAPRLSAILRALQRRSRALEAGAIDDVEGLDRAEADRYRRLTKRRFTPKAWFIRSEKGVVEVSEDYRLQGELPERPIDEQATRRLSLHEDARGEFLFPHGLL
jgi:hypothetical protein